MDLTTNGIIVNDAIKYVQGKMDHLNTAEKKLLHDIREDVEAAEAEDKVLSENSEREEEQQQTHNRIF
jgi:hemerythrin-like domain-containing protein